MTFRKPSTIIKALGGVLLVLLCLGACAAVYIIRCNQQNTPPEAPIYPESSLMKQWSQRVGTSRYLIVVYDYTSADPPEEIVAFYAEKGYCRGNSEGNRITCQGEATPFGEYFVYWTLAYFEKWGTSLEKAAF
jgi:hypothetical protein